MSNRSRNRINGLKNNTHLYGGEDFLNEIFQKSANSKELPPGIYEARSVGNIKMNLDPESKIPYRVLAYIPELDESVGEPFNYAIPSAEHYQTLKFFEPLPTNLQPPSPGDHIMIQIINPIERVGYYVGKIETNYKFDNIKGKSDSAKINGKPTRKGSDAFKEQKKKNLKEKEQEKYSDITNIENDLGFDSDSYLEEEIDGTQG